MTTIVHKWVTDCRNGVNPRLVCKIGSGWVVMGEAQFLSGYCLVLPDPVEPHLNTLTEERRIRLMHDVAIVGDAILAVTGALRCNYEILGNQEPALHIHVFPRFSNEPEMLRTKPVWFYDWNAAPRFDPQKDAQLLNSLRNFLKYAGIAC
ncbi:MAG: hypothetical protein WD772_03980 [Pseudohongiellaceae bacterium]